MATATTPDQHTLARSARSARAWPSGADPRESVVRALLVVAVIVGRKFSATLASSTLHRGPGRVSYLRQDHLGDTRLGALIQFTVAPIYHFFSLPMNQPAALSLSSFRSCCLERGVVFVSRSRVQLLFLADSPTVPALGWVLPRFLLAVVPWYFVARVGVRTFANAER